MCKFAAVENKLQITNSIAEAFPQMQDIHPVPVDPDRLVAIAQKWGTPTYIYIEKLIRERCRMLVNLFSDLPVSWLYAIKANDNPHIMKIIADEGLGFDTVSFEEVLLSRKTGIEPHRIFYTENNMTDAEMNGAVEQQVILNIGSLSRLESFCSRYPGSSCCIRIKPDIGDGHHAKVDTGNEDSKFGIRMDQLSDAIAIAQKMGVRIEGIHAHIGSGISEPENLLYEINVLLEAARYFDDLAYINFGGGIPIPYRSDEPDFDLARFAKLASERLQAFINSDKRNITFYFEPGRWIVGPGGILLTQINTVKDQGRKTFLGTDTGFNHLIRPALYDSYHGVVNISASPDSGTKVYDVAGNICESGDILACDRELPVSKTGDYLAILDAGAYGMTMASMYNRRALPAEILITEKGFHKVIRRRKSPDQTVAEFLADTGFDTKE